MFLFDRIASWSPAAARERLRRGHPPRRLHVAGRLELANSAWLSELPRTLTASAINIANCAKLSALPQRVKCDELILANTNVVRLDGQLEVARRIDAMDCRRLQAVAVLSVPELRLRGCTQIARLPEGLNVRQLDVSGCTRLVALPVTIASKLWSLDVSGCTELAELPTGLAHLQTLNVRGCTKLKSLPDDIRVQSWVDVADSGLQSLPYSLHSARVLWRGMPVPDRIAFSPETITVREILQETNLEFRRVLLERVGVEWFVANARAETLDSDVDAGGPRRLLRVPFENGENVVCLEVQCPSTARKYVLRVPPGTQTCAEGAAWIAGFNNPRHYRPVVET